MEITLRTKDGWSEPRHYSHVSKDVSDIYRCPECGAKLFMAPHGARYCDRVHAVSMEGYLVAFMCPLCKDGPVAHKQHNGTHIYVCDACPFVALEYYTEKNEKDLSEYLNR